MWCHTSQRSTKRVSGKPNKGSRVKPCGRPVGIYIYISDIDVHKHRERHKKTLTLMACWVKSSVAKDAEIGQSRSCQFRSLCEQMTKQILSGGKTRERSRQTLLLRLPRAELLAAAWMIGGRSLDVASHLAADSATRCHSKMRRKSLSRDRVSVTRFVSVSLANGNDAQCRKLIGIRQIKLKKKLFSLSIFISACNFLRHRK